MNGNPLIILLVEDDPGHAELVTRSFEEYPLACRVIHMTDGQAALDYLCRHPPYEDPKRAPRPGLVLLDLRLPKVDGLEVLRTVKKHPELQQIPIVVLTTSAADSDMHRAYECGANSYLVKPVGFPQFSSLMESIARYWLEWNRFPHAD